MGLCHSKNRRVPASPHMPCPPTPPLVTDRAFTNHYPIHPMVEGMKIWTATVV
jgi:hypothetical protein